MIEFPDKSGQVLNYSSSVAEKENSKELFDYSVIARSDPDNHLREAVHGLEVGVNFDLNPKIINYWNKLLHQEASFHPEKFYQAIFPEIINSPPRGHNNIDEILKNKIRERVVIFLHRDERWKKLASYYLIDNKSYSLAETLFALVEIVDKDHSLLLYHDRQNTKASQAVLNDINPQMALMNYIQDLLFREKKKYQDKDLEEKIMDLFPDDKIKQKEKRELSREIVTDIKNDLSRISSEDLPKIAELFNDYFVTNIKRHACLVEKINEKDMVVPVNFVINGIDDNFDQAIGLESYLKKNNHNYLVKLTKLNLKDVTDCLSQIWGPVQLRVELNKSLNIGPDNLFREKYHLTRKEFTRRLIVLSLLLGKY